MVGEIGNENDDYKEKNGENVDGVSYGNDLMKENGKVIFTMKLMISKNIRNRGNKLDQLESLYFTVYVSSILMQFQPNFIHTSQSHVSISGLFKTKIFFSHIQTLVTLPTEEVFQHSYANSINLTHWYNLSQ